MTAASYRQVLPINPEPPQDAEAADSFLRLSTDKIVPARKASDRRRSRPLPVARLAEFELIDRVAAAWSSGAFKAARFTRGSRALDSFDFKVIPSLILRRWSWNSLWPACLTYSRAPTRTWYRARPTAWDRQDPHRKPRVCRFCCGLPEGPSRSADHRYRHAHLLWCHRTHRGPRSTSSIAEVP